MTTATMDGEVFSMLRGDGLSEELAAKWAGLFARRESVLQADIANLRAKIPDREADRAERKAERETERAADREVFAAKDGVAVLQNKVKTVEDAIISIDKRFDRMDERFNGVDKSLVRLDEQMKASQRESRGVVIPLLFATLGALIALLTKGSLWGVVP